MTAMTFKDSQIPRERDPKVALTNLADLARAYRYDSCTECGFGLDNEEEGCDACLPVKVILAAMVAGDPR